MLENKSRPCVAINVRAQVVETVKLKAQRPTPAVFSIVMAHELTQQEPQMHDGSVAMTTSIGGLPTAEGEYVKPELRCRIS